MLCMNGVSTGKIPTTYTWAPCFVCNHCGKIVSGGEYIQGVFYCPMCASIIHRNNRESREVVPVVVPISIPMDKQITY